MPLGFLEVHKPMDQPPEGGVVNQSFESVSESVERNYGSVGEGTVSIHQPLPKEVNISWFQSGGGRRQSIAPDPNASLRIYLQSIVYMPHSIRMLCLTNLFCWMAHVCYSLYFTDFVGEAVFGGDPTVSF